MTNFESIRQMTVPEMVRLLESIRNDFYGRIIKINGCDIWKSFDSIEEWLESEVDNNDLIEVVRCKDCIYRGRVDCAMSYKRFLLLW